MNGRERLFSEEIRLGLEVGGEESRIASEEYGKALEVGDNKVKHNALRRKAEALIIQNPGSGFGLGRGKRKDRFFNLTAENLWREPSIPG